MKPLTLPPPKFALPLPLPAKEPPRLFLWALWAAAGLFALTLLALAVLAVLWALAAMKMTLIAA